MAERIPCDLDRELAEFLRKLMVENGWSYSQLELKSGVKRAMLHNLVNLQRGATLSLVSRMRKNLRVQYKDIFPNSFDQGEKKKSK